MDEVHSNTRSYPDIDKQFALIKLAIDGLRKNSSSEEQQYIDSWLLALHSNYAPPGESKDERLLRLLSALQGKNADEHGTVVSVLILALLANGPCINTDLVEKLVKVGVRANPASKNKSIPENASDEAKLRPGIQVKLGRMMKNDGAITMEMLGNKRHQRLAITDQGRKWLNQLLSHPTERQKEIYDALGIGPNTPTLR